MANTLTFKVVGENRMNCGGCERSVVSALRALPGVDNVRADHTTQDIQVWLASEQTGPDEIIRELEEIGYQAERQ